MSHPPPPHLHANRSASQGVTPAPHYRQQARFTVQEFYPQISQGDQNRAHSLRWLFSLGARPTALAGWAQRGSTPEVRAAGFNCSQDFDYRASGLGLLKFQGGSRVELIIGHTRRPAMG
ncbi:hypothetical protein Bbelb_184090 [Branchiostoma belcheri]|nr:hypothetical protein Bbelb_184090 [Branchiostoma belcheri]